MNLPLLLTSLRVVLAVAVGALLLAADVMPFCLTLAAVLFIVAAVTDFFDGRLARARNQTTSLGAFLDPLADKLLVYLAFLYLTAVGVYPVWLLMIVFTRDIVTDSLRAFAAGSGVSMPANMISKWKSLFQMASIGLLLVLVAATELQRLTQWGGAAFTWFVSSPLFDQAFGATFWLMLAAAAVGIVGTIQYVVEYGSKLFKR